MKSSKTLKDPELLRAAMKKRRVSYRQLGVMAGCSYGTIYNLLARGANTSPDLARSIARSVECGVGDLFINSVTVRSGRNVASQKAA